MKTTLCPLLAFLFLVSLFVSCAQSSIPAAEVKAPAREVTAPAPKAGWEQKWDGVLSEAKKEGTVALYSTTWSPETRVAITQAFDDKYGINVELTPFTRGADLQARVKTEQRAGLFFADVFGAGNSTLLVSMKPDGLLGPLEPLLILPEVRDPQAWRGGRVPFGDKEGLGINMIAVVMRTIVYNANLIKEGEITSYKDLLKPQYKGKITMSDPSAQGAGNAAITHLGENLWGDAEAADFLRRLIREQDVVLQRDVRIHVESVARGKYAIALAANPGNVAEFMALKAPIGIAIVKEDNRVSAGAGSLGVPTKFAHPNAAVVFVNWLLTKEGQTVFARRWGNPSTRVDVPTEGMDSLLIPVPGEKYYMETEDILEARGRWLVKNKKIMDESTK